MKKTILFILFILTQVLVYGQGNISFEKKKIDLGDIDASKKPLKLEFKFKNTGNEPLIIEKVASSYSHFKISYPQTAIAPGKDGVILVEGYMNPGSFNKTITVLTTGLISMTLLYIKGNNTSESVPEHVINSNDELEQGGTYKDWFMKNIKTNLIGLDKQIMYQLDITIEVDRSGKISKAEFSKSNLPKSLITEIERLINNSPTFNYKFYNERFSIFVDINKFHYTNPDDKAVATYMPPGLAPDTVYVNNKVNGGLKISVLDMKKYYEKYHFIFAKYIVERDGSITNVMGQLTASDLKLRNDYETVKKAIKKIEAVGKTKPGILNANIPTGKKGRSECWISVIIPRQ